MTKAGGRDDWRQLLAAGQMFREMAPWERFDDWPLLGMVDPVTGALGFGSVLGAGGEQFGLVVFRGATGLWGSTQMTDVGSFQSWDHRVLMHHLNAFSFALGARDEVDANIRKMYRELGYSFRGQTDWPVFDSLSPGYAPAAVAGTEIALLTRYVRLAITFAERLSDDAALRDEWETRSGYEMLQSDEAVNVLCLAPAPPGVEGPAVATAYGEAALTWRRFTPESPVRLDGSFDQLDLAGVRRQFARRERAWEFEVCPSPILVGGRKERAATVQIALGVDEDSGIVLGFDMVAGAEAARPAANLLEFIKKAGYIPAEIGVTRVDVAQALAPFAAGLDIEVVIYEDLPGLEEAFFSLVDHLAAR